MDGWMDGWMDGRTDDWMAQGKKQRKHQRRRCTKCYMKFPGCTCTQCYECVGIISLMGRDRHHCRRCGIPLCANDWIRNDSVRGKKVCRVATRCEQRQLQVRAARVCALSSLLAGVPSSIVCAPFAAAGSPFPPTHMRRLSCWLLAIYPVVRVDAASH